MKKITVAVICFLLFCCVVSGEWNLPETDVTTPDEAFVLDAFPLEPERVLSENAYTNARVFNSDFSLIATPNANGNIYIQDLETQEIIAMIETTHEQTVMDVVFSENDAFIAVVFENRFEVYEIATAQKLCEAAFGRWVLYAAFIKNDEYLIVATGEMEDDVVCHYSSGASASEPIRTIYTIDLVARELIQMHQLDYAECIYGITDDDMYICTDGGENYVAAYACFSDEILYDLTVELYQNVSFYPFDQNGEYFIYEWGSVDCLQIFDLYDASLVYELEIEYQIYFLGSQQIAYQQEDGTTVIYDFVADAQVATVPLASGLQSQVFYQNIAGTDKYIGFESTDIDTSRYFIYDLSDNIKYSSTNSYEHRAGMTMLYYFADKTVFLYQDSYGWNAELYHYEWYQPEVFTVMDGVKLEI